MPTYTTGFRTRMVQRMTGRESITATALSSRVGVSQNTLSRWLREASAATGPTVSSMKKQPSSRKSSSRGRTAEQKLEIVVKAAALSDEDLGAFLRREGIHEVQLQEWRAKAMEAATRALKAPHGKRKERTPEFQKIRALERELLRKDKALAEVTALLVLKKKIQELLGDEDDSTPTRNGT